MVCGFFPVILLAVNYWIINTIIVISNTLITFIFWLATKKYISIFMNSYYLMNFCGLIAKNCCDMVGLLVIVYVEINISFAYFYLVLLVISFRIISHVKLNKRTDWLISCQKSPWNGHSELYLYTLHSLAAFTYTPIRFQFELHFFFVLYHANASGIKICMTNKRQIKQCREREHFYNFLMYEKRVYQYEFVSRTTCCETPVALDLNKFPPSFSILRLSLVTESLFALCMIKDQDQVDTMLRSLFMCNALLLMTALLWHVQY